MWFWKIMVRFFIAIDSTLFNFIASLYDLLIAISRTSILSQGDIAQFATRIEILLGIFMLFKMSFSLITYIVNPDDFVDRQKGFGKLVQNSVISLVLLVLVPYIFQMAFNLQTKILYDNLLAKLLLGEKINDNESDVESNKTIIYTAGNQMAFQVMLPFFLPNYSIEELSYCVNIYDDSGNFNSECKEKLSKYVDSQALENYSLGIQYESLGLTFRSSIALETDKKNDDENTKDKNAKFIIDYKYPLSTVAGVITCLLLITFCIDVGVRSVKLAFLQLIYPIPVISFMDPKSGKDGIFSKWYKMCLTTFLSLFIRLIALYFGIYVISRVGKHGIVDIINGSEITNGWVKLFIIIGILMFVKQMPKMLENLGIKLDGDGKFNLNPLKKVMDENNGALGAKRMASAAGGFAVGAMHGRALRGLVSGAKGGKGFGEAAKAEADHAARLREARMNGSTWHGRLGARVAKATGFGGRSGRIAKQDKIEENKEQRISDQIKQQENSIAEDRDYIKRMGEVTSANDSLKSKLSDAIKKGKAGAVSTEYKNRVDKASALNAQLNNLDKKSFRKKDSSGNYIKDKNGEFIIDENAYNSKLNSLTTEARKAQEDADTYLNKDGVGVFYNNIRANNNDSGDAEINGLVSSLDNIAAVNGVDLGSDYDALGKRMDKISKSVTESKNNIYGVEKNIDSLNAEKAKIEVKRNNLREEKARHDANNNFIK